MAGLTERGLEIRTQPEIQEIIEAAIHEELPGLDLSQGPEHQIVGVLSEELAIVWEGLQAVYSSQYPSGASGLLLDKLLALTGSRRRAATRSIVVATVNLNAGVTLPAGSVAAVDGDPDAQFRTVEAVTNGAGAAADVSVEMESIPTGPIAAPAGTLTEIVTAVSGWNSVENDEDATLGRAIANDAEARTQRKVELAGAGSGTVASIRASVADIDEVIEVTVYENVTMATVSGRPAKSFEVVVWDEEAADDDEVAQAIWDHKPAGIQAYGTNSSGTAIDDAGNEQTVAFTRAHELRVYVAMEVELVPGTGSGWENEVQAAVEARGLLYGVGESAYKSQIVSAVHEAVPAILAVTDELGIGTTPAPFGGRVDPAYDEIIRIDASDVAAVEG